MSLSTTPLLPNPDGSPPNFDDPPSLKAETYSVSITLMTASVFLVAGRLYANLQMSHRLALDDYFCILACVLATAFTVLVMTGKSTESVHAAISKGFRRILNYSSYAATNTARHMWDVPISAIDASWIKRSAVLGTIYGPAMWFVKTAILTMYLRLFSIKVWMRRCCYYGIAFLFCAYWSLVPVSVVYNFPHGDEKWDLAMTLNSKPAQLAYVIMGLISVIADVFLLILPFPILLTLRVSWKKKMGLALVFLTGIIGIVASCVVFALRVVLWQNQSQDMTGNLAASYLTVVIEMNVAVIVSCAPAAAAFWKLTMKDAQGLTSLRSVFASPKKALRSSSVGRSYRKAEEPTPKPRDPYMSLDSLQMRPGDLPLVERSQNMSVAK